jgi:endonuclease G, mitochondrial
MKKILVSFLLFAATANAACDNMVAWGFPKPKQETISLCQIGYYTEWNSATKNPMYSAEYLIEENVSGVENRRGEFKPHPNIPAEKQASNWDYARSGFDRGHMAPAGDMRKDSAAMQQSFYLTNMVPQYPDLNRRVWAGLERYVRLKVTPDRPLYVITGPVYDGSKKMIGNGVYIPSHTFKVIYDLRNNKVASYMVPNAQKVEGALSTYFVEYERIEELTGINFFPAMSVDVKKFLKQLPLDKNW